MKEQLSTLDLAIWVALIAAQLTLVIVGIKRELFRRLPLFSLYALVSAVDSVFLLIIAFSASYATYYRVFYLTGHIVSALAFLTLIEFGRQVLPGLNLPQREKAISYLLAAVAPVALFVCLWPIRSIAYEKRIEVAGCLAVAITFGFIAGYSRFLGLRWSRLLGGVALTLGFMYLVDGVTKALIGHYPFALAVRIRQAREVAHFFAVVIWIVVVLSPWGEHCLTEDMLMDAAQIVTETEVNLRSFALEGSTKA